MKNFSQATAIDHSLKVLICLQPVGQPWVRVGLGQKNVLDQIIDQPTQLVYYCDLLTPLDICVELKHKTYSLEHETAIIVDRLDVDLISLVPKMTYCFVYDNDHEFLSPTNYLGFNGTWRLNTAIPFYRWWHQQSGQGWLLEPTAVSLDGIAS